VDKDEALKLGLQLVATAEYLATDAEICGKDAKEERALIQQSKIAFEEALAQPDDLTIAYMSGVYDGKNKYAPQREWVGLTEPEVDEAYKSVSNKEWAIGGLDDARVFFCAIEAKLKEKNGC
jgi:hypothetical protein